MKPIKTELVDSYNLYQWRRTGRFLILVMLALGLLGFLFGQWVFVASTWWVGALGIAIGIFMWKVKGQR